MYRNAYVVERFGKEQAEIKLKAVSEFAQKAGLKLSVSQLIIITLSHHVSIIPALRIASSVEPLKHTGCPRRHIGMAVRACRINSTRTYSMRVL